MVDRESVLRIETLAKKNLHKNDESIQPAIHDFAKFQQPRDLQSRGFFERISIRWMSCGVYGVVVEFKEDS